jgi:hypothetical protein
MVFRVLIYNKTGILTASPSLNCLKNTTMGKMDTVQYVVDKNNCRTVYQRFVSDSFDLY